MITHFEVSNFKSIKHLSLDLRKFMVFVGPNGAGKTNLVRAMEVFGEVLRRGTVEPIQEHGYDQLIRREKRPARSGLRFTIRSELPPTVVEDALKYLSVFEDTKTSIVISGPIHLDISIEVTGSVQADEVTVSREELILRSPKGTLEIAWNGNQGTANIGDDPVLWFVACSDVLFDLPKKRLSELSSSETIKAATAAISMQFFPRTREPVDPQLLHLANWQRQPTRVMRYMRDISQVKRLRLDASALRKDLSTEDWKASMLGPTGEGLASAISKLRGSKSQPGTQFRKVLEELQEVYPRIEDVFTRRFPSGHLILLFKEHGISDELGQGSVSDGVLHALALLVALHQEASGQAGLLVIEDPENAIHPWPLRKLISRAQNSSRQIILTTHSETVVNAVVDPEALFLVENDNEKGTIVAPATERESALKAILEESGQKIGDVWLDGGLGGVPGRES